MRILTADRLREVLEYDPLTGQFCWLIVLGPRTRIGSAAGTAHRYHRIDIDGTKHYGHRLAFLYMTGKFPELDVDHIDGNTLNNKWSNLREASVSENIANSRLRRDNTSGLKGVCWNSGARKWRAQISVNGRVIYLGCFASAEVAHEAYIDAAIKHFGEFARIA